ENNDPFYLHYLLSTQQLNRKAAGSGQPLINQEILNSIEVKVPPLSEQKAIAAIISCFDDKIELLRRQNKTLESIAQAIFKEWFVKFKVNGQKLKINKQIGLPEGWRIGNLGELIEFINGYAFKSSDLLDKPTTDCYKIFKMGNIKKGGGFEPSKTKSFIKKDQYFGQEKHILRKGDLLMSMTDMKDAISLLGHTALMTSDNEYVVNQRVGLIRASNDLNIGYPFLYLLTNSAEFLGKLRGKAHSGVQVNLSTSAIKRMPIVIPEKLVNINFSHLIKPIFEKVASNLSQIQTLSKLRDTLLPKLMKGEIRIKT
ncbi:MAG: restriction endonuclease subunit S, partial [Alphaproteobacteria bacterium]